MEKMKKIKNMCELEKYVGEMAHKKLMFCKGFYLSTGVPFYDDYFGCKPCAECKECKRYLYRRQYILKSRYIIHRFAQNQGLLRT